MKTPTFIAALFFSTLTFSQAEIVKIVFKDKSNFDIITLLDNKLPTEFFVLATTDKWNAYRFHLNEQEMRDKTEHSPYIHSYIFKDTMLNRIISDNEKQHLYELTQISKPRPLADSFGEFTLIKSFTGAKKGFLFSVTDPIYTTDEKYVFIDITIYKKDKKATEISDAYYGRTLLIYEKSGERGWTRLSKIDYLIT